MRTLTVITAIACSITYLGYGGEQKENNTDPIEDTVFIISNAYLPKDYDTTLYYPHKVKISFETRYSIPVTLFEKVVYQVEYG